MVYACSSHQQGLQKAFSILAESDAGVHPATWSSEMAALKEKHSVELFEWKPHEPAQLVLLYINVRHTFAQVCQHLETLDRPQGMNRKEVGVAY